MADTNLSQLSVSSSALTARKLRGLRFTTGTSAAWKQTISSKNKNTKYQRRRLKTHAAERTMFCRGSTVLSSNQSRKLAIYPSINRAIKHSSTNNSRVASEMAQAPGARILSPQSLRIQYFTVLNDILVPHGKQFHFGPLQQAVPWACLNRRLGNGDRL